MPELPKASISNRDFSPMSWPGEEALYSSCGFQRGSICCSLMEQSNCGACASCRPRSHPHGLEEPASGQDCPTFSDLDYFLSCKSDMMTIQEQQQLGSGGFTPPNLECLDHIDFDSWTLEVPIVHFPELDDRSDSSPAMPVSPCRGPLMSPSDSGSNIRTVTSPPTRTETSSSHLEDPLVRPDFPFAPVASDVDHPRASSDTLSPPPVPPEVPLNLSAPPAPPAPPDNLSPPVFPSSPPRVSPSASPDDTCAASESKFCTDEAHKPDRPGRRRVKEAGKVGAPIRHDERERKRRAGMSVSIQTLDSYLPDPSKRPKYKRDRATILFECVDYIKCLRRQVEELDKKLSDMRDRKALQDVAKQAITCDKGSNFIEYQVEVEGDCNGGARLEKSKCRPDHMSRAMRVLADLGLDVLRCAMTRMRFCTMVTIVAKPSTTSNLVVLSSEVIEALRTSITTT